MYSLCLWSWQQVVSVNVKLKDWLRDLYPDIFFPFANLSSFNYSSGPTNGFILTPSSQLPLGIFTESVCFKKGVSLKVPIILHPSYLLVILLEVILPNIYLIKLWAMWLMQSAFLSLLLFCLK